MTVEHHSSWMARPFVALWQRVAGSIGMPGRLVAIILGAVLILVGVSVSLTLVGAIVGIPLAILGLLMVIRGLF